MFLTSRKGLGLSLNCMKKIFIIIVLTALSPAVIPSSAVLADENKSTKECYESIEGRTNRDIEPLKSGEPNIKCSTATGAVLLWGDPFDGTIPGDTASFGLEAAPESVFVRPREKNLKYFPCTMCHEEEPGQDLQIMEPHPITMHEDIVKNPMDLQHGKGSIWCFDCHNVKNRDKLIDRKGKEISFNQPVKLCGGCHAGILRDFRDGIHGKRIGMWSRDGKKRWWVCTECHNPHDVEQGGRNSGFAELSPEPAPHLPKGMTNADHERK